MDDADRSVEPDLGGVSSGLDRAEDSTDRLVSELIRNSFGGDLAHVGSTAPVVLPKKEDLTVRLVTQHSLDRLKDAESDRALFDATLWCLIGGVIGFFTNVITGNQGINKSGWIFLVMLTVSVIGLSLMRLRVNRRLKKARKRVSSE